MEKCFMIKKCRIFLACLGCHYDFEVQQCDFLWLLSCKDNDVFVPKKKKKKKKKKRTLTD